MQDIQKSEAQSSCMKNGAIWMTIPPFSWYFKHFQWRDETTFSLSPAQACLLLNRHGDCPTLTEPSRWQLNIDWTVTVTAQHWLTRHDDSSTSTEQSRWQTNIDWTVTVTAQHRLYCHGDSPTSTEPSRWLPKSTEPSRWLPKSTEPSRWQPNIDWTVTVTTQHWLNRHGDSSTLTDPSRWQLNIDCTVTVTAQHRLYCHSNCPTSTEPSRWQSNIDNSWLNNVQKRKPRSLSDRPSFFTLFTLQDSNKMMTTSSDHVIK
jgi:hypothetical protein